MKPDIARLDKLFGKGGTQQLIESLNYAEEMKMIKAKIDKDFADILEKDEHEEAKHERRADRVEEREEELEEFDFERDCGART